MSAGSNKFGNLFQWTTFGESHGPAMGVVIDGCPAGLAFDESLLQSNLQRRRPGQAGTTSRQELDSAEVLSGVFQGKTLGTPIAIMVRNTNQKSQDYDEIQNQPRIGHADDVWQGKFQHWDHRGGARASARETLNWVIAGSVAQMFCRSQSADVQVEARLKSVAGDKVSEMQKGELVERLELARSEGESFGAVVELQIEQPPKFLGEPIFLKAKSEWARAFMMINACVGVELGDGFEIASAKGTDVHMASDSKVYGGIRGGMTTGERISFQLAFKPTSSILDTAKKGRHDPCVALRALPIVEAMTWNVLADLLLAQRLNRTS